MWDIIHVYYMKEFIDKLVKWIKCKLCCAFECSLGEEQQQQEEKKQIRFNYRRNSL